MAAHGKLLLQKASHGMVRGGVAEKEKLDALHGIGIARNDCTEPWGFAVSVVVEGCADDLAAMLLGDCRSSS
jgi:hypothetical protein